jgi:hypothetical protein
MLPERRHPVREVFLDIDDVLPVLFADFGISVIANLYFRVFFRPLAGGGIVVWIA